MSQINNVWYPHINVSPFPGEGIVDSAGNYSTTAFSKFENLRWQMGMEVFRAYDEFKFARTIVKSDTIDTGHMWKDYQRYGRVTSEYQKRGEDLLGLDGPKNTKIRIHLDTEKRVAHTALDSIDELFAPVPRMILAQEMAYELALQTEIEIFKGLILGSRLSSAVLNADGGTTFPRGGVPAGYSFANSAVNVTANQAINHDTFVAGGTNDPDTPADAQALLEVLDEVQIMWAKTNIPFMQRNVIIRPSLFYALQKIFTLAPTGLQYNESPRATVPILGSGQDTANSKAFYTNQMNYGDYYTYKGFKIWMSNLLPNTNRSNDLFRAGDFSNTIGVICTPEAYAHIDKLGVEMEMERKGTRDQDFIMARTLIGGGTLRPECVIEISAAADA